MILIAFLILGCESNHSYVEQEVVLLKDGRFVLSTYAWHDGFIVSHLLCYEEDFYDDKGVFGIYSCFKLTDSVKRAQWNLADKYRKEWIDRSKPITSQKSSEQNQPE